MKDTCRHKVRKSEVLTSAYEFMEDKESEVPSTPSIRWTHDISGKEFDGSCLVYKDRVFIKTNMTEIVCLDHSSGTVNFVIEKAFAKSNMWAEFIVFEDKIYAQRGRSDNKIQVYDPLTGKQVDEIKAKYYWDIVDDEKASDLLEDYLDNVPDSYTNEHAVHGIRLPRPLALLSDNSHKEAVLFDLEAQKQLYSIPSSNPDYLEMRPLAADEETLVIVSRNRGFTISDPRRKEPPKSEGFVVSVYDAQSGGIYWKNDFPNFACKYGEAGAAYGNLYGARQQYYDKDLGQLYVIVDSVAEPNVSPEDKTEVDFKMLAIDVKTGNTLWEIPRVTNFEAFTKGMLWSVHKTYEQKYPYKTKKTMLVGVDLSNGKETFRKKVGNSVKFHEITGGKFILREGKKISCYG